MADKLTPKRPRKKAGRPTVYTQDVSDRICYELSIGRSLRKICLADDMPAARTVHMWLLSNEPFMQQYTQAREIQADTIFDECIDIADMEDNDMETVDGQKRVNSDVIARDRLRIDTRKWMAGKLRPKRYGEKVDHTSSDGSMSPKPTKIELVAKTNDNSTD